MVMELGQLVWIIMWALLLLRSTSCDASSNLNQSSNYGYEIAYHKHSINALPCFKRYVVEPFFKEHDGSSASCLQEYILHKIPFGSHTVVPVLLDLERQLIGEGSHRRLSSIIKLSIQPDMVAYFSSKICEIIYIERLPSGAFADPFELEHLLQRGVFKDVSVFGDTNLELPSFLSNQSIVEVHLNAALNTSVEQEIITEYKIEIPLHARYPPLAERGYSNVKFGIPHFFLRCMMDEESPIQTEQTCIITPSASNGSLKIQDILWSVPAGINAHSGIVTIVTFTSAILSVVFIVVASFKHAGAGSNARLKQS